MNQVSVQKMIKNLIKIFQKILNHVILTNIPLLTMNLMYHVIKRIKTQTQDLNLLVQKLPEIITKKKSA